MKQQSGLRLTFIAVICGLAAAALTVFYLKQVESKYKKANKPEQRVMVTVVVPNQNLKKGSVITPKLVAARKVPQEFLPSNAILAEDFKKVMNRTLLMPLEIGRPITWEAVTGKSAKTYSENIELGRRSRSVKVSKIDSFDGLLRPGDRIDLMGNFTLSSLGVNQATGKGTTPENVVMPILENVEVLAAGKEDMYGRKYEYSNNKNSPDGFNMDFTIVGLNLSPKQIARVEIAEGIGDMFAVLRHPKDTSVADFKYVGVELLFEKDEPAKIDIVMGANGKTIGKIVGDNIVDENGNIVGKMVNGKPVSFDGKSLGTVVKKVSVDDPMLNVAEVVDVVRDANGKIIGKIVDGKIIDENGNVVGEIRDGQAVSSTGEILGKIDKGVALDINGNEVDLSSSVAANVTTDVVRDADGNIIGTIVDGQVVDAGGNVIGVVKDGKVLDADGNVIAENVSVVAETVNADVIVRDADGNVIGTIVDGQVVDASGKVIGVVKDGQVVDMDGKVIADNVSVKAESPAFIAPETEPSKYQIEFVDFISGGTAKDGIVPVTKVRKE